MELELKKAGAEAYETGGEIIATHEESAETILPDYCPDMARIIESDGMIFLHSREYIIHAGGGKRHPGHGIFHTV